MRARLQRFVFRTPHSARTRACADSQPSEMSLPDEGCGTQVEIRNRHINVRERCNVVNNIRNEQYAEEWGLAALILKFGSVTLRDTSLTTLRLKPQPGVRTQYVWYPPGIQNRPYHTSSKSGCGFTLSVASISYQIKASCIHTRARLHDCR